MSGKIQKEIKANHKGVSYRNSDIYFEKSPANSSGSFPDHKSGA
jgi:hypothetical protein